MKRFHYYLIYAAALALVPMVRTDSHAALGNAGQAAGSAVPAMSAERLDDRIVVRVKNQTFTSYRFGAGQKYPYFYPVNGPLTARTITTESAMPYPHHRSLFFGCDKVNGGNYWQEGNEQGQIVSKGASIAKNGPDFVLLQDDCEWRQPGQNPIIADHRDIRIEAPSAELRIIDFHVTLTALTDIRIERTNHALFSARVEPQLSVSSGGTLINAEGATAEKGTYGVGSAWCDYSGKHLGVTEGIAIFDSPGNRWFPCKWFTRDYGFFSPTPMEWIGQEGFTLRQGERLPLRYRVVVHAGDVRQAGIGNLFLQWQTAEKGTTTP
jgi:hypothetical protein